MIGLILCKVSALSGMKSSLLNVITTFLAVDAPLFPIAKVKVKGSHGETPVLGPGE